MEDSSSAGGRSSGIPRLSRLPVPRAAPSSSSLRTAASTSSLKTTPSRESLSAQSQGPQLRAAASRDRLSRSTFAASTSTAPEPRREAQANTISKPSRQRRNVSAARSIQSSGQADPNDDVTLTALALDQTEFEPATASQARQPCESEIPPPSSSSADVFNTSQPPIESESLPYAADAAPLYNRNTLPSRSARPRPSLSERTIETLSQLPSSPAISKKSSTFFDSDGTRRSRSRTGSNTSRPGSSYTSDGSMRTPSQARSRPGSSSGPDDGAIPNFRASTNTFRNPLGTIEGTPSRRTSGIASLKTPATRANPRATPGGTSKFASSAIGHPPDRSASPSRHGHLATPSKVGSKTVAARPLKPRASINGLFKKPSLPAMNGATAQAPPSTPSKPASRMPAPSRSFQPSKTAIKSPATTQENPTETPAASGSKSSAALRDQIAKAKAAKRAAAARQTQAEEEPVLRTLEVQEDEQQSRRTPPKSPIVPADDSFDFGLSVAHDPFNTKRSEHSTQKILQQRLSEARSSGRLNIAAMGLKTVPSDVLKMYDAEFMGTYDGSWAENVDLTRFVAADNEIETIDDDIFPDVPPEQMADDEDSSGNVFGGLETLDLHGNLMISVPSGLRQLRLLTSLNLSSNRLANNCLEPISQITTLRDLKLSKNLFYGPLDPCLSNLQDLEILDLHGNNISSLPVNFGNLERLRILNISDNSFEVLPFTALCKMPLTELFAQKNELSGTLIEDSVDELPRLQTLDVSCNQLQHLASPDSTIRFPSLYQLIVSMNRLKDLPDMSTWTSLLTLGAEENSISAFPGGFLGLDKLRHVDFASNDLRTIPAEVARMDNLSMIRLSGNPLREKKFVSATTEELKDALAARLEPPPPYDDVAGHEEDISRGQANEMGKTPAAHETDLDSRSEMDDFATPPTSAPHSPARSRSHTLGSQTWPIKQGGVLDRSHTESSSLHPVVCSKIAAASRIYEVQLNHNLFTIVPESLSFFADTLTTLSLAHNKLVGETYLPQELELPALRDLSLANNHITSLAPLTANLRSPELAKLDASLNRITALPIELRTAFPQLAVLLAANNHLEDLDPAAVKGMQVVDAANNDITHLNPKLGLLGGTGGLTRLEVSGNRFRVPRWSVLERGTEATLRWLRGRVPVAEMASWKESQGPGSGMSDDDELD